MNVVWMGGDAPPVPSCMAVLNQCTTGCAVVPSTGATTVPDGVLHIDLNTPDAHLRSSRQQQTVVVAAVERTATPCWREHAPDSQTWNPRSGSTAASTGEEAEC